MKPPPHWSAIAILEAFGRQSGIGARRYMEIALQGAEPTDEEDRALREGFFPLGSTSPAKYDTTDTVDTAKVSSEPARRSRAMMTEEARKHRLPRRLAKLGITVTELARDMKFPRTSVQAWYKPKGDPARRPCPPEARRFLAREPFNIPPDSWE